MKNTIIKRQHLTKYIALPLYDKIHNPKLLKTTQNTNRIQIVNRHIKRCSSGAGVVVASGRAFAFHAVNLGQTMV